MTAPWGCGGVKSFESCSGDHTYIGLHHRLLQNISPQSNSLNCWRCRMTSSESKIICQNVKCQPHGGSKAAVRGSPKSGTFCWDLERIHPVLVRMSQSDVCCFAELHCDSGSKPLNVTTFIWLCCSIFNGTHSGGIVLLKEKSMSGSNHNCVAWKPKQWHSRYWGSRETATQSSPPSSTKASS